MLTAKEFLDLPAECGRTEITKRYRELALKWHPDKSDRANADYIFKLIDAARTAALEHSSEANFPALVTLKHRLSVPCPEQCECGWFFENEFMCESCGNFVPGLRVHKNAPFPVRERFWKIARRICVAKTVDTEYAKKAYFAVFEKRPNVLGRHLQE